ncbi:MAG: relaxase/mobilization nuclease domain-containing protein, partial [Clostridia bacterium]|nr:relaxase/mobilization nuclease domain-containing protein [Clostridia bacterium]
MPVTKREPHYGTPQNLIEYILDERNYGDKVGIASSINCNVETALLEFKDVQNKYQMKGRRVAYHIIQSFSPLDNITPEQANEIGKKLCKELYPDFQCVISTHIDKGHLHNHIALNAININGRKLEDRLANEKEGLYGLSDTSDKIAAEYGCFIMPRKTYLKSKKKNYYYQYKEQSYKEKIKEDINTLIDRCSNLDEFLEELSILGYEVRRGKNIAVKTIGMIKFARLGTIDEKFTEQNLYKHFRNQGNIKIL